MSFQVQPPSVHRGFLPRDLTLPDLVAIVKAEMGDLRGPPGEPGRQGDPGVGGSDPYVHHQEAPSATWVIDHPLGRYPASVAVVDTAGTIVWGQIDYTFPERVTISFSAPFAGVAYLL